MSKKTEELVKQLREPFSRPMKEEEIEFCRDAQGAIDFALRNGLTFAAIASILTHDMNEIARYGFDLRQAKARGFVPKVSGYSNISAEDFGEVEEAPDDNHDP